MNKTVYVSEGDWPIFERAQSLFGGNLSAAIAHALRLFVDGQTLREQEYQEITVVVGLAGSRRRQRFWGRHLADWRHPESSAPTCLLFSVYRTRRQQWALHRRRVPLTHEEMAFTAGHAGEPNVFAGSAPRLDIYGTLNDLKRVVPPELARLIEGDPNDLPLDDLDV